EAPRDGALAVRETIAMNDARFASIARRWPATRTAVHDIATRLGGEPSSVAATADRDARVPVRSPEIRGPLGVYYYDHFSEALDARGISEASLPALPSIEGLDAGLMTYEALNLADGKRSVSDIRDTLTGRYAPVPTAFVATYFERLARAGIVTWR
ncbi:MAG: hypothetical protein ABI565_12235, partial [Vicinamibacteria bacterium]